MFVCPRCRERLVRTKTKHGVFFVCRGCQGRAVGVSVVRRMAGRKTAKDLWQAANHPEARSGAGCPTCHRQMASVPLPVEGREVPLDVCTGCHVVWFDPQELEQLPEAPAPIEEKPIPQEIKEQIAVAEAERVAERAEAEEEDLLLGPADKWKWIPALFGMPVETKVPALRTWPWVTWGLAVGLAVVFAWTQADLKDVVDEFGLKPAEVWRYRGLTLVTSLLLHGGLWHLLANGYFLLVFGDNVEDYLGRWRYVLLLGAAALAGEAAHVFGDPRATLPCIGASGAISGVITFYALRFPEARLGILLRYWLVFGWLYMPAYVALILWFLLQFLMVFMQFSGVSDVSALAHLGGAAVGVLAWLAWRQK